MVGAEGIEPSTFWSRTKRATRLRYAPMDMKNALQISKTIGQSQNESTYFLENLYSSLLSRGRNLNCHFACNFNGMLEYGKVGMLLLEGETAESRYWEHRHPAYALKKQASAPPAMREQTDL